jgi:hypothetical protein
MEADPPPLRSPRQGYGARLVGVYAFREPGSRGSTPPGLELYEGPVVKMCRTGVRTIDTGRAAGRRCRLGKAAPSACASSEDHRDGQPRRTGRLHHHLQLRALRAAGQGRRLTSVRLSSVGHALRLATGLPSPARTRTLWALAMPRSMPTRTPVVHLVSFARLGSTGSPAEASQFLATVPRSHAQPTAPTHVLQTAPTPRIQPLPSSGASVAGPGVAIRRTRPDPHWRPSRKARFDMDRWEACPQGQGSPPCRLPSSIGAESCY